MIRLLKMKAFQLSRPYADVIYGSLLSNLKELRKKHRGQSYRAFLFLIYNGKRFNKQGDKRIVILHGFIKKTQTTPDDELALARKRLKEVQQHG